MGRSSVERLPAEVRTPLEGWLREFRDGRLSLDEVMVRLDAQFGDQSGVALPSRSAVHRHAAKVAAIGERLARARAISDQLVQYVGPEVADGKGLQVLIQGFQSLAFDLLANMPEEGLDPENLMFLARSIGEVARAQKTDADRALSLQREALKQAAAAVKSSVGQAGLSAETAEFVMARILGVSK